MKWWWEGRGDSRSGPLSSRVTLRYHGFAANRRTVHTHTRCTCFWFSKFNYTWSVPANRNGEKSISVEFKDSPTPILASYENLKDYTVQERVSGLSFCVVAIDHSCQYPHSLHKVDSLNIHSTHPICANAAAGVSALDPKLGMVRPGILSPGTCALTPNRGQCLGVPQEAEPSPLGFPVHHEPCPPHSPSPRVLLGALSKSEVSTLLPKQGTGALAPLLGLEEKVLVILCY